jgi:hypothetical protein
LAARLPEPPRKRRTREHIIADLSVNHLERHVLLAGYTMERVRHDYGLDMHLWTYDENGEVESDSIHIQVKVTEKVKCARGGRGVRFRLEGRDIRSWLQEAMPVLLVVYDAAADTAFWLYVQAYFQLPGRRRPRITHTTTVYIPRENVVTVDAVRRFGQFKAAVLAQIKGIEHRRD